MPSALASSGASKSLARVKASAPCALNAKRPASAPEGSDQDSAAGPASSTRRAATAVSPSGTRNGPTGWICGLPSLSAAQTRGSMVHRCPVPNLAVKLPAMKVGCRLSMACTEARLP